MCNRVVNMAIETSFKFLCTHIQTPRYFFYGSKFDAGDMDERGLEA